MAKHIQHRLTDLFLRKRIKEPRRYTGNMPFCEYWGGLVEAARIRRQRWCRDSRPPLTFVSLL